MTTVNYDMIQGASGTQDSKGWIRRERVAIVEGVTGVGDAKLDNAIAALTESIGDAHPTISGLYLREFTPEALSTTTVRVRMLYSRLDRVSENEPPTDVGIVEIGGSLSQVETNKDHEDNLVELTYTYQDEEEYVQHHGEVPTDANGDALITFPYTHTVSEPFSRLAPQYTLTVNLTQSTSPGSLASTYVGKVNNATYRGGAAQTWLCTSITGTSRDGGETYNCRFEFEYNPDTWNKELMYTFPRSGKFPDATQLASNGNASKSVQIYPAVNFSGLPV